MAKTSGLLVAPFLFAAALALSACSDSQPEEPQQPPHDEVRIAPRAETPAEPEIVNVPAPVEPAIASAPELPDPTPDAQTLEDADATGMTARVDPANATDPAALPDEGSIDTSMP